MIGKFLALFLSPLGSALIATGQTSVPSAVFQPVDGQVAASGVARLSPVELTWESTPGPAYDGWFSEDLENWTRVFSGVPGNPPRNTLSVDLPAGTSAGFFRVGVGALP